MKAKVLLLTAAFVMCLPFSPTARAEFKPGLAGTFFMGEDFTREEEGVDVLESLDNDWGSDRGNDWAGRWAGFIEGPFTGEVTFTAKATDGLRLIIDGAAVIDGLAVTGPRTGKIAMEKGKKAPIILEFTSAVGNAQLHLSWEWAGQPPAIVPGKALSYDPAKLVDTLNAPVLKPKVEAIKPAAAVVVKNVIVYYEQGRFGGWPANNGVWSWGNEILVGFSKGYFKANDSGHSIDRDKKTVSVLGRSTDGGETWTVEDPENFVGDEGLKPVPSPGDIDFANTGFAMRVKADQFFISNDRGKTWKGPYLFPDFGKGELSSRTDYLVNGPKDCLIFMSAKIGPGIVESDYQDRAFCARTTDGGKTFQFQGWMADDIKVRSVMPATVRISDTGLVTAMRRKHTAALENDKKVTSNYIDAAVSSDNGKTWTSLGKVADTDLGAHNGNPPSAVRLKDGRICVAYGYRSEPYGIRAKISADNGKTWGPEIHLRDDGRTWDLGYTRSVLRPDGKVVTMYYYTTKERPEQHIAATIWDPDKAK